MMSDFDGKVVVITGSSSGIGLALAEEFLEEGARVVLSSHDKSSLQNACQKLSRFSDRISDCLCDVTCPESVEALAEFAWSTHGVVDIVINNAGIMYPNTPTLEMPIDQARAVFDVNFFGAWHGLQAFGKRLITQGRPASIYITGSENSLFHGVPMGAAYVASKHAVLALAESLREEMPEHIKVGLICPGFVATEMIPDEAKPLAMPAQEFAKSAISQIADGDFYIVTHAYNIEPIKSRYQEIESSYGRKAPRYDGDIRYDVRTLMAQMAEA